MDELTGVFYRDMSDSYVAITNLPYAKLPAIMDHVQIPETAETMGFSASSVNSSKAFLAAEATKNEQTMLLTGAEEFT